MSNCLSVDLVTTRTLDGIHLHGALAGRAERGGVLVVHGAWGNFYATPVAELLRAGPEAGLAALSMNGRGHDMGGLDDGSPSIGFLNERLEFAPRDLGPARDILVAAGASRFLVVGHSYGCARITYWLREAWDPRCVGVVLVSPPPPAKEAWATIPDNQIDRFFAEARQAIEQGDHDRILRIPGKGPVPIMASAATVLSIWAPGTQAFCELHLGELGVPSLVVVGEREASPFHRAAERTVQAANGRGELLVVDDDHFYRRGRAELAEQILGWAEASRLWEP